MKTPSIHFQKIHLIHLSAFLLPFFQTGSIICWVLAIILQTSTADGRSILRNHRFKNIILWLMPLFFLMHVLGMLWSVNLGFGWRDLETKMSFLILPFVIASFQYDPKAVKEICRSFIFGIALSVISLLFISFYRYNQDGNVNHFFYAGLTSPLMHPTYLSIYLSLALYLLMNDWFSFNGTNPISWHFPFILLFIFLMMQFSARSVILSNAILIPAFCIIHYLKFRQHRIKVTLVFLSLVMGFSVNYFFNQNHNRFLEVNASIQNAANGSSKASNSINSRFEIWRQAISLYKESPLLGYGTGDVKDVLVGSYTKTNFTYALEKKLNAHNQFLQTAIALGLTGVLFLICMFVFPLFPPKADAFTFFILTILINALTESLFETQKGVVFTAFFYSLFLSFRADAKNNPGIDKVI